MAGVGREGEGELLFFICVYTSWPLQAPYQKKAEAAKKKYADEMAAYQAIQMAAYQATLAKAE